MFMRQYPGVAWKSLGPCVYRSDGRFNRSPQAEFLMQMFLDECRSERCAPLEELAQNGVDPGLGLSGGQFQDPKIVLGGARGEVCTQSVVARRNRLVGNIASRWR
jgi:hypothetical protein